MPSVEKGIEASGVEVKMDLFDSNDVLFAKFKAGKTAWFIVFQTKEAGIGIPVSLDGFPKAIDSLP